MPLIERAFLVAPIEYLAAADDRAEPVAESDLPELAAVTFRAVRGTVDERGRDEAYRLADLTAHWDGRPGRRIPAGEVLHRDGGRPVAYALTSFLWGLPVIDQMAVDPSVQRQGHGSALVRGIAHALDGGDYRVLAARVSVESPIHAFLVALGFEPAEFPGIGA
jgi:GNAT superfamily N-acetyltransferase